jgi:hypothetical protein
MFARTGALFCSLIITAAVMAAEIPALASLRAGLAPNVTASPVIIADSGDAVVAHLNDNGTTEVLTLTAQDPSPCARRVRVAKATDPVWGIVATSTVSTAAIKRGDVVALAVWVRAAEGAGYVTLYSSLNAAPWTEIVNTKATLGSEWQEVRFAGVAPQDYAAGTMYVSVHLGSQAQVVDIGAIVAVNAGSTIAINDLWKK